MKILLINKFYHDQGKSGGVGRHILELEKMFKERNHEIIPFATRQEETIPNDFIDFFPEYFDLSEVDLSFNGLGKVRKIFHNREAADKLERLIDKTNPDIAHIHNIYHHLSPSILEVLKKRGIPVVMTVHDYKLICPNYTLFNHGKICQRCKGGKYYNCLRDKCIKDSRLASGVLAAEAYYAKARKLYERNVDLFIVPSKFVKNKLVEFGMDDDKIEYKYIPNFLAGHKENAIYSKDNGSSDSILYFGRLSAEKGISALIEAMGIIESEIGLVIAGSGPEEEKLKRLADKLNLGERIDFVGHKNKENLEKLILESRFVVVPSLWFENAPYSILESFARSKAVIASQIGGIPELVREGETGLVFEAGNKGELAEKIDLLVRDPEKTAKMGERGREDIENKFSKEKYADRFFEIVNNLLKKR